MTRQNAIPSETNNNNDANPSPEDASKTQPQVNGAAEENTQTPALIPFWDLANHMDGVVMTAYNIAGEQIEGATNSDIKKDQQIFIHYGNRNNANLLVHNGYGKLFFLH